MWKSELAAEAKVGKVGERSMGRWLGATSLRIVHPNLSKVTRRFSSEADAGNINAYSDDVSRRLL